MESLYKFNLMDECSFVAKLQIEMNPSDIERIDATNYLFVDIENDYGNKARCMIFSNPNINVGQVKISKRCLTLLGENNEFIYIHPLPFQFVNRGIPKIENINKQEIVATNDLVEKYSSEVELINITNGYRMLVNLIGSPTNQDSNKIYINRYQLLLLGLDKEINERLIITSAKHGNEKNIIKKLILWIKRSFKGMSRKLGNIFVGYRELDLRVGYIYPFDENHRVTRMHPNIRRFLGLEENDRVIVSYNQSSFELPVLDLDTEHANEVFKIENEFIDSHLYIGIPATTRNQLGVPNIGTIIKVRRSMKFLLKKHINKLILPLMALWFTLISLIKADSTSNIIKIIVFILIISPIVIFASLSEERSKVK